MEDGFCTQLYTGCIRMTMFLTGRESRWPDVQVKVRRIGSDVLQ